MKFKFLILAVFLFAVSSYAQWKTLSKDEYKRVFDYAVSETNEDFPFVFEVVTVFYKDGKPVRTFTERNERQSESHERIKKTETAGGRSKNQYQIRAGSGNVFCSEDGISWKASEFECGSQMIFGWRAPESVEYSVTEKVVGKKPVKVYREYSVFAAGDGSNEKYFEENISAIDSRGFFVSIEGTEGLIDPKTIALTRKQTWTKSKIKPIVAPLVKR